MVPPLKPSLRPVPPVAGGSKSHSPGSEVVVGGSADSPALQRAELQELLATQLASLGEHDSMALRRVLASAVMSARIGELYEQLKMFESIRDNYLRNDGEFASASSIADQMAANVKKEGFTYSKFWKVFEGVKTHDQDVSRAPIQKSIEMLVHRIEALKKGREALEKNPGQDAMALLGNVDPIVYEVDAVLKGNPLSTEASQSHRLQALIDITKKPSFSVGHQPLLMTAYREAMQPYLAISDAEGNSVSKVVVRPPKGEPFVQPSLTGIINHLIELGEVVVPSAGKGGTPGKLVSTSADLKSLETSLLKRYRHYIDRAGHAPPRSMARAIDQAWAALTKELCGRQAQKSQLGDLGDFQASLERESQRLAKLESNPTFKPLVEHTKQAQAILDSAIARITDPWTKSMVDAVNDELKPKSLIFWTLWPLSEWSSKVLLKSLWAAETAGYFGALRTNLVTVGTSYETFGVATARSLLGGAIWGSANNVVNAAEGAQDQVDWSLGAMLRNMLLWWIVERAPHAVGNPATAKALQKAQEEAVTGFGIHSLIKAGKLVDAVQALDELAHYMAVADLVGSTQFSDSADQKTVPASSAELLVRPRIEKAQRDYQTAHHAALREPSETSVRAALTAYETWASLVTKKLMSAEKPR